MKYDYLEKKLERIVCEAKELAKREKTPSDWCSEKCLSCLVAEARGNDDKKEYGMGFSSSEDIAMIDAKYELLELPEFATWENR